MMSELKTSRRSIIKKLGVTAAATSVMGTGIASASDTLTVYIWKTTSNDSDEASEVFDVVANFVDQLYTRDIIGGYGVREVGETLYEKYGFTWGGKDDCDSDSFRSNLKANLDNESADVHIAVTNQTELSGATKSNAYDGTNEPGIAFVGTSGYDYIDSATEVKKRYKNAAIQEMNHTLIDSGVITNGPEGHKEHALGVITDEGHSTPMLTFYEPNGDFHPCSNQADLSSKGDCQKNNSWNKTHTHDVTQCTFDAIEKTHTEHNGFNG